MADSDRQKTSSNPGLIIILTAAIGALVFHKSILETTRPGEREPKSHECKNLQRVDARIWEDPFSCILKSDRENIRPIRFKLVSDYLNPLGPDEIEIFGVLVDGTPYAGSAENRRRARYAVLSALYSSGFFPQDPYRIGIGAVPFGDKKAGHDDPKTGIDSTSDWFRIPFEVFQQHSRRFPGKVKQVLVLWISEDQLGYYPLRRLLNILCEVVGYENPICGQVTLPVNLISPVCPLFTSFSSQAPPPPCKFLCTSSDKVLKESSLEKSCLETGWCEFPRGLPKVKFIGPETSTILKSMIEEVAKARRFPEEKTGSYERQPLPLNVYKMLFENVRFYSPTATAEDEFLLEKARQSQSDVDIESFLNSCLGMSGSAYSRANFLRTTLSDGALAKTLVDELSRRQVDISPESRIVLLSEWDSAYGRALPESIRRVIKNKNKEGTLHAEKVGHTRKDRDTGKEGVTGEDCPWVYTYSYPRGLDGQKSKPRSPAKDGEKEESGTDSSKKDEKEAAIKNVIAEGDGQFDYLKRLQESVIDLQNSLKRDDPTTCISAIGVFGTDAFDKLLILRALRPYFPGAIFFTTELDAVLLHQKESKWARNLVIASSFGFELHHELQKDIFPFRSSSQTAQYLATYIALHESDNPSDQFTQKELNEEWLDSRIFEIGNTKAIDLSLATPSTKRQFPPSGKDPCDIDSLYPQRPYSTPNPFYHYLIVLILLAILLCASMPALIIWLFEDFACVNRVDQRYKSFQKLGIIVAVVLIAAAVALFTHKTYQATSEEPFYWLEGVSIWPTEIIRGASLLLALAFIWYGGITLKNSNTELEKYFPPVNEIRNDTKKTDEEGGSFSRKLKRFVRILFYEWSFRKEHPPAGEPGTGESAAEDPSVAWRYYREQSRFSSRLIRVLLGGALYGALVWFILTYFGKPHPPVRGEIAPIVDSVTLGLLICAFVSLLFFVLDSTRLCKFMADCLSCTTKWPRATSARKVKDLNLKLSDRKDMVHAIDSWIDIEFFAKHSKHVTKLIYYPFIILAAGILARSNVFGRWETPLGLLFVFMLSAFFALYCALMLRHTAEKIRRQSSETLKDLLVAAKGDRKNQTGSAQLEVLIQRVERMNEGAFAPFSQQPAIRAILFPLGSLGSASLLQYLSYL